MGGGKSAPAPEVAAPIQTTTAVGNALGATPQTLDPEADIKKEKTVDKKKLGARGLQIPLAAESSTTKVTTPSPASTGITL